MNKRAIIISSRDEIGVPSASNMPGGLKLPWLVKDKIGVGIINPRGIKKLTMVGS